MHAWLDRNAAAIKIVRRLLAGALLGLLVLGIAMTYIAPGQFAVCRDAVDQVGGATRLCGPIGLSDVPAIAVAILAILLLLPDLTEIGVGGGLATLKIAVASQEKKTDQLETRLLALSMKQETNVQFTVSPDFGAITKQIAAKERGEVDDTAGRSGLAHGAAAGEIVAVAAPPSPERAVLEAEILRTWEALSGFIGTTIRRPGTPHDAEVSMVTMYPADNWLVDFRDEVQAFQALRNTVAHQPQNLTDAQVRDGVELGRKLLDSLSRWLGRFNRP